MNQKIFSLALAASLLLNGFFIGGYWVARKNASRLATKTRRIEAVAHRLNLTPAQQTLFRKLKNRARQMRKDHRIQTKGMQQALIRQLAADTGPSAATDKLIDRLTVQQAQYLKEVSAIIRQFFAALDDPQRKQFRKLITGNKQLQALFSG